MCAGVGEAELLICPRLEASESGVRPLTTRSVLSIFGFVSASFAGVCLTWMASYLALFVCTGVLRDVGLVLGRVHRQLPAVFVFLSLSPCRREVSVVQQIRRLPG